MVIKFFIISAVKYYLNNDVSINEVCKIFNCKKQSLSRWTNRYNKLKNIKRQITMKELTKLFHSKKEFS